MSKTQQPPLDIHSQDYVEYCQALEKLVPINTEEKAAEYRKIWEKFHKKKINEV